MMKSKRDSNHCFCDHVNHLNKFCFDICKLDKQFIAEHLNLSSKESH